MLFLKSHRHFSKDFYPKGGPMPPGFAKGGIHFSRGGGGGGAGGCEVP